MCDTLVVVRPGAVLFAKSSDRDPNEAQLLDWQPRRRHPAGALVRCTWVSVPQVRETHAVLLSRPFWTWGAEMGANEHGVVLGNEAVFTRQPYAAEGLTGMDLVRLALERASSAREAIELICSLLDAYGQGGGCGHEQRSFTYHNSFLAADAGGAFVLETAGRHWQAEPVPQGVRSISNVLSIPGFAAQHGDRIKSWAGRGRLRQARNACLAAKAEGAADLLRVLRDHGPGREAPAYDPLTGGMSAPCMHAGGLVANAQTTASWVAELRPEGARHWVTATAAPCTGLFKPVRVDEPLDLGPPPSDRADGESLWWRHEKLHRRVLRSPGRLAPLFAAERDAVESLWLRDPPPPKEAFAEGGRLLERWERLAAAQPAEDCRPWWARRYWRRRDQRAGLQL
jgi:secernin